MFSDSRVEDWFGRRTFGQSEIDARQLAAVKRQRASSISVCLPALNEAATIGSICRSIRVELIEATSLVDELVVIDTGSTDDTIREARRGGATVFRAADILPGEADAGGKGEALWKSLAVTTGDIVVWLDSDTRNFSYSFVIDLVAPLLANDDIVLTKAFYERPLVEIDGIRTGGARLTELVVRPMLNLFYPTLAGLIQPVSGECGVRRQAVHDLPFLSHYAVDIGLVIDIAERYGLEGMAQVDLGTRVHRNRDVAALGRTAHQVLQGMLMRFEALGLVKTDRPLPSLFTQFAPGNGPIHLDLLVREQPRMSEVLSRRSPERPPRR